MSAEPKAGLSIYTDASFATHNGKSAGSWCGVIVRKKTANAAPVVDIFSGAFKDVCPNSTIAEMQAMGNAIAAGLKAGLIRPHNALTVYSDCASAIDHLTGRAKGRCSRRATFGPVVATIRELIAAKGLEVQFCWIPGHQGEATANAIYNSAANYHCRKANPIVTESAERRRAQNKRKKANRKARLAHARESAGAEA